MKFRLVVAAAVLLSLSVTNAKERGAGFNAPTISGKENVYEPKAGEIIYDDSDTQFWGYSGESTWLPLGTSNIVLTPAGTVITFAGATCPDGYLGADGAAISRSTYSGLFSAIGTGHGTGNGTTTFNLPDYRGKFLRGVDGTSGSDPDKTSRTAMATGGNTGNNVGSVQTDGFKSHVHGQVGQGDLGSTIAFFVSSSTGAPASPVNTQSTGGNETRPKNAYVNFCVKY